MLLAGLCHNLYNQGCYNIDFSNGNFDGWHGKIGICCPLDINTDSIAYSRHTILTINEPDANTCNNVYTIPQGYSSSFRLGNAMVGAQAESISYNYTITDNSELLIIRYAVVLQDPGHEPEAQPRFEILIKNTNDNDTIDCSYYYVYADSSDTNFAKCNSVLWKDWTTVGFDLSAYNGQEIMLELKTGDCSYGGHFGYAYVVAECAPLFFDHVHCPNDSGYVLSAPPGFASYNWSNGYTSDTIYIPSTEFNDSITCTLTTFNGCETVLEFPPQANMINVDFSYELLCDLIVKFTNLSTTDGYIQSCYWDFGDGTYSTSFNSIHQYSNSGTYLVSLIINTGCFDTLTMSITIDDITNSSEISAKINCDNTVTINILNYNPNYVYQLYLNDTTYNLDGSAEAIFLPNGEYTYLFYSLSDLGCEKFILDSLSLYNTLMINGEVFNVLIQKSINGNNVWDLSKIVGMSQFCQTYQIHIYDRWGILQFSREIPINNNPNCDQCFMGYNNDNAKLNDGIYYYYIYFSDSIYYSGFLHIFE